MRSQLSKFNDATDPCVMDQIQRCNVSRRFQKMISYRYEKRNESIIPTL